MLNIKFAIYKEKSKKRHFGAIMVFEFIHLFYYMRRTNYGYIGICHELAAIGIAGMNLTILRKCLKRNCGKISGNFLNIACFAVSLLEKYGCKSDCGAASIYRYIPHYN